MKPSETSADELPENVSSGPTRRAVLGAVGLAATAALAGCVVAGDVGRKTTREQYSVAGEAVDRIAVSGGDGKTIVRVARVEGDDGSGYVADVTGDPAVTALDRR